MPSRTLFSRLVVVPALLVLPLGAAHGQRLDDGEAKFGSSKMVRDTRVLRNNLFKGLVRADPRDKDHQDAIDIAAKECVYPLHWFSEPKVIPRGKINRVVEDFTSQLSRMSRVPAMTGEMQQLFCRKAMDDIVEVIQKSKAIAGVNAAMMLSRITERRMERGALQSEKSWSDEVLPRLAEGNAEHMAGLILDLLKDAQENKDSKVNDGVKFYLFRALAGLLGVPSKMPLLKKDTEEKVLLAALDFVEKNVAFPRVAATEEVNGYRALRREAIKVVAQASSPTVGGKGKPALALARIAAADTRVSPSPHLSEQIEASIGLANLLGRVAARPGDLQLDTAALQVVRGVVDFGDAASDKENIAKKGWERRRPWKVEAARLIEATGAMKGDGKNNLVNDAVTRSLSVLSLIEDNKAGQTGALNDWLKTKKEVADAPLYKGDASTAIKAPASKN